MNLLIEYFHSNNTERNYEFLFCINQNLFNPHIKKMYVFISDDSELNIKNEKIVIVKLDKRPTYQYLFNYCNDNLVGEVCIIANTDIFFDFTLGHLSNFDFTYIFLALTRWDVIKRGDDWGMRFYDLPWWDCYQSDGTKNEEESITTGFLSQDSWIFKSPIKVDDSSDYLMGKPGCDNRITQIMSDNGYSVRNPSKLIISKHFHQSNHRTYSQLDTIPGPYLLVKPSDNLNLQNFTKSIPHF